MKTSKPYTVDFKDYGPITVPAGTKVTHQTACGYDPNYHFVSDLNWIDRDYHSIANILRHDVTYYGINVPKEFIEYEND